MLDQYTYIDINVHGYAVIIKMSRLYTHCQKYIEKIQQHGLFRSIYSRNYRELQIIPTKIAKVHVPTNSFDTRDREQFRHSRIIP